MRPVLSAKILSFGACFCLLGCAAPLAADTVYDSGSNTVAAFENSATLTIEGGAYVEYSQSLTNDAGASLMLTQTAVLQVDNGAVLDNLGGIVNAGATLSNQGSLSNSAGASLSNLNGGQFVNVGALVNNGTWTNGANSQLESFGSVSNNSLFTNAGQFSQSGGSFSSGVGSPSAVLDNLAGGLISSEAGNLANDATLNNAGIIHIYGVAVFCNGCGSAGAVLTNTEGGSLLNEGVGTFDNEATFNNSGSIINSAGTTGSSGNASAGFHNGGTNADALLVNEAGASISNVGGAYFDNEAIFENYGSILNDGTSIGFRNGINGGPAVLTNESGGLITNTGGGIFENDASMVNLGSIFNETGAGFDNTEAAGNLVNHGLITDQAGSKFTNGEGASFTNAAGGVFDNAGAAQNIADFENSGTVINEASGSFQNAFALASLTNTSGGLFVNEGLFQDDGGVCNQGNFLNAPGAVYLNFALDNSGGSFTNDGSFNGGGVLNENGGTFVSAGSTNIGSYTQDAGSTLVIALNPAGADAVNVSGAASLAGSLRLDYAPGSYAAATYTLISASAGVSGTFNTVGALSNDAQGLLSYQSDTVDLSLNGQTVSPNDGVYDALRDSALYGAEAANQGLLRRLDGLSTDNGDSKDAKAGAWENNSGDQFRVTGSGAYTVQGGNLSAGMDRRFGSALAGFSLYDGQDNINLGDGESGSLQSPGAALYGSLNLGPVRLGAAASYAQDSFQTSRPIALQGQTASSAYQGQQFAGSLQAETSLPWKGVDFRPEVGAQAAALDSPAVSENGAPNFNLDLAGQESASLKPYLGLAARRAFSFGKWVFDTNLNLGCSWETLSPAAGAVTANGAGFSLEDASLQRSQTWIGGGFAARLAGALSLNGDYSLILPTGNLLEQTLSLGLRYRFL